MSGPGTVAAPHLDDGRLVFGRRAVWCACVCVCETQEKREKAAVGYATTKGVIRRLRRTDPGAPIAVAKNQKIGLATRERVSANEVRERDEQCFVSYVPRSWESGW